MSKINISDSDLLTRYYQNEIMRILTQESWLYSMSQYEVLPKPSLWRRIKSRLYWKTVGAFRSWLHRDCGEW